jgi:hypothetical protein
MSENFTYQPSYTITPEILNRVAAISEAFGWLTVLTDQAKVLRRIGGTPYLIVQLLGMDVPPLFCPNRPRFYAHISKHHQINVITFI